MKNWFVFFIVMTILPMNLLWAQNPYIRHYTTSDGLPTNTIYYLYQDSKNFIWIATDAGVVRYDGSQFVNFTKEDGLSSNEVTRIREDSYGRIWFLNLNTTVNFSLNDKIFNERNTPFLKSLKGKEFFKDCFEDHDHVIYFFNLINEVFTLDKKNKIKRLLFETGPKYKSMAGDSLPQLNLRSISLLYPKGFLFYYARSLYYLSDLNGRPWKLPDSISVSAVFYSKNQNSYIYNSEKCILYKYHNQFKVKTFQLPMNSGMERVHSVIEDQHGFLWVATFNRGIYCLKNSEIILNLPIKQALSMLQDNENNIWISSMNEGLFKINPNLIYHKHLDCSLFHNKGVMALTADPASGVWLTNGSQIYHLDRNQVCTLNTGNIGNSLTQVCKLKNDELITGEQDNHYYLFKGIKSDREKRQVTFTSRKISPFVLMGAYGYYKKIIIDQTGEKVFVYGGNHIIILNPANLFQPDKVIIVRSKIYNAFFNENGDILINSEKNYLYHNSILEPCKELASFDNKIITGHLILDDTIGLFNIEGDSIYLLYHHLLYHLKDNSGLQIDRQIRKIIYHQQVLYMATSNNIFTCENPSGIIHEELVTFKPIDINFRNIHDILCLRDSLFIASDDGLTVIPVKNIEGIGTSSPLSYFRSVFINDSATSGSQKEIMINSNKRLQINFGSINFSGVPVIFSYKLGNADNDWITGTGKEVVYQHLPLGKYSFYLRVRKPTSPWSKPIKINIRVQALFWQHPLFYISLFLVLTGLVTLYIIRRNNNQLRRQEEAHQLIILEQKALQSMMNPHFIFNALGSIQSYLLQNRAGEAGLYLSQFARLIRQNLNAINAAFISNDDEVDRIKNYLDLEKLRMDTKFDYRIDVDESFENDDILIPSMIIQPFVENAVWHGIAAIEVKGQIGIGFSKKSEKEIKVIIEDNGIGMQRSASYSTKTADHMHLGVEMTRKRLELLGKKSGINTSITFSEKSHGSLNPGTIVELIIPVMDTAEEVK